MSPLEPPFSPQPIVVTLSALPGGETQIVGFTQLWLRYVHGFSPHFHCQRSLRGTNDPRFCRTMPIGRSYKLHPPARCKHIYLCGVTARRYPGLHLALVPEAGAHAEAETYNGIQIQVSNVRRLVIPAAPLDLLPDFPALGPAYTTCCNWLFGVAYYGVAGFRPDLVAESTSNKRPRKNQGPRAEQ